jgi:valyl-tRNA synthetase
MQHNLEFINIFTDNGKVNSNGGKEYKGMKHFDAHVAVERGFGAEGELLSSVQFRVRNLHRFVRF